MAQETEIKLRVANVEGLRSKLRVLGARLVGRGKGTVRESNVLFDTPGQDLRRRGELLRIRTESWRDAGKQNEKKQQRFVVTFKRPIEGDRSWKQPEGAQGQPDGRHKVREEIEMEVSDALIQGKIFEGLGMRGWFRYEKLRTTYQLPTSQRWARRLLIEVDETPIGVFVELEGPAKAIDRGARLLGYSPQDYIVTNYLSLYLEECRRRGEKPGDMVFRKGK